MPDIWVQRMRRNILRRSLSQVLHGTLDSFGAHVNRNLFRLSVEEAKTWNIIAGMFKVSPEQLKYVHGKAVGEVKQLGDRLTYEKVYADPCPLEYSLDLLTGEDE
jgi:DNA-directed RNA polymerase sigma subunit (sigma70/sigma32)